MKVCIVGAGAIGGFIGARLAAAGGAQVSALARGATLAALRTHGWRLQQGGALIRAAATASSVSTRMAQAFFQWSGCWARRLAISTARILVVASVRFGPYQPGGQDQASQGAWAGFCPQVLGG